MDYPDIFDAILKKIIQTGKGIEINTSGFSYKLSSTIPDIDIIKRYKQLGGQIHATSEIDQGSTFRIILPHFFPEKEDAVPRNKTSETSPS